MRKRSVMWLLLVLLSSFCAQASVAVAQEEAPAGAQPAGEQAQAASDAPAPDAAAPDAPAPAPAPTNLDKWNDAHSIPRMKRPFFYWPKLLAIWLLFLIWVKSADWVNRDTQIFDLGYGKWNPIVFFPFLAVLLLFVFPIVVGFANFWLAIGLLSVAYLATFVPYVVTRNKSVQMHEKVFTPDWFRYEIAHLGSKVGLKISA